MAGTCGISNGEWLAASIGVLGACATVLAAAIAVRGTYRSATKQRDEEEAGRKKAIRNLAEGISANFSDFFDHRHQKRSGYERVQFIKTAYAEMDKYPVEIVPGVCVAEFILFKNEIQQKMIAWNFDKLPVDAAYNANEKNVVAAKDEILSKKEDLLKVLD